MKNELESERNKFARLDEEQQKIIASLKEDIQEMNKEKEKRDKSLEEEFDKLSQAYNQIKILTEKQETLEKENQQLKSSRISPQTQPNQSNQTPRGTTGQGNIPSWKQRELEKAKEAEEQRERESRAKIEKVQSLRTANTIETEGNKNFRDPLLNKPTFHGGVVEDEREKTPVSEQGLLEQEKIDAELARMNRVIKKGGHAI